MLSILQISRNAFRGLSKPTWMLAAMVLINRSGAMVLPFIAIYATEALHYNLQETGIILSVYGLGSVSASILGGWLTDKVGHFIVQFTSQVAGGLLFFIIMQLQQFEYMAIGVFFLSFINDTLRPANAAAIVQYATPETVTRAFSLNRMSVNLGFIIGPALGGLLIAYSYKWIFIVNGITGVIAGLFFLWYFCNCKENTPVSEQMKKKATDATTKRSPYRDYLFLLFVFLCTCFSIIFYQIFSTLPLYYTQVYQLPESQVGFLFSFNGFVVLTVEMVMIYLLAKFLRKTIWVVTGVLLLGFSFVLFNLVHHSAVLIISMLLFSLSEILTMPFMSTITAERSNPTNRGTYMGLFTISWAMPLVVTPYLGTLIISTYDFSMLWWASGLLAVITALGLYWVVQFMEQDKEELNNDKEQESKLITY